MQTPTQCYSSLRVILQLALNSAKYLPSHLLNLIDFHLSSLYRFIRFVKHQYLWRASLRHVSRLSSFSDRPLETNISPADGRSGWKFEQQQQLSSKFSELKYSSRANWNSDFVIP